MGLKVYHKQQTILNVYGVNLSHYGYQTKEQNHLECYLETVDMLQSQTENCTSGSSVMILCNMNTCLPSERKLSQDWYRIKPFPKEGC